MFGYIRQTDLGIHPYKKEIAEKYNKVIKDIMLEKNK